MYRDDNTRAPHLALGHKHCVFFTRFLPGVFDAVCVFLLITELQRIGDRFGHFDLDKHATVENRHQAVTRTNRHVVIAIRTHVQIIAKFSVEQHGPAIGAFCPKIVGHFAA